MTALPRVPGSRDSQATRQALLAAAIDSFAAHGYDGATVDDIARRARVNKAMISYHFGGKLGLHGAVLREPFERLSASLAVLREENLPALQLLPRFLAAFQEVQQVHPDFAVLLSREVLEGGRHLPPDLLPRFVEVFQFTRDLVERGIREGVFRRVDPALTHLTLIGSLVFFHGTRRFRERVIREHGLPVEAPSAEGFLLHLQELMRRGLAADPKEA